MKKSEFRDLEKYKATKRRQQNRWRQRGGAYLYEKTNYTAEDDDLILRHEITDRELSQIIKHSVGAIQRRRCELKKGIKNG